ncbi:HNH endonuclease [Pusillimonas sp. NJUB218]|uniref:HNH endonuclease n=1 Tax=Pusillimonas sp. NJUB218 TaxID=2023230 RepID=UPI003510E7B9
MACSGSHRKKPFIIKKGYKKILLPTHPRADAKGYVFEHIIVAEAKIGRPIRDPEEVHHKDFNKLNNSPDNLVVCADHAQHMAYHALPLCSKE